MTRFSILLIAFLSCASGTAQERFFNFVNGWANNAAVEVDGEYLLFGMDAMGTQDHILQINSIGLDGVFLGDYQFAIDTAYGTGTQLSSSMILPLANGNYLTVGSMQSLNSGIYATIYEHDLENESIEVFLLHQDADNTQFYTISAFNETSFLVGGSRATGEADSRIYCISYDGSILWTEDFSTGGASYFTLPEDVIALENGNIAALFWEIDFGLPAFHDREKILLVYLDSSGNELWRTYPGDFENYRVRPGNIVENEGALLLTYTDPYYYEADGEWQPNPQNKVWIDNYNFEGVLQSTNSVIEPAFFPALRTVTQSTIIEDDNMVISGFTDNHDAFLTKITTEGELVWSQRYSPYSYDENPFQETALYDFIVTSDGGFLCTGRYIGYPGGENNPNGLAAAIALKVDEFGCLVENCQIVGVAEHELVGVSVSPNPVVDYLKIKGLNEQTIIAYSIISLTGGVLEKGTSSNHTIDLTDIPQGAYIIQIEVDGNYKSFRVLKL